jgi:hypothetical protein
MNEIYFIGIWLLTLVFMGLIGTILEDKNV